jgi:hypothetical protein
LENLIMKIRINKSKLLNKLLNKKTSYLII